MKQPTPVFLSYMDFPYAIEGGSTKKIFWVLNKLYMAKRKAILKPQCDSGGFGHRDMEVSGTRPQKRPFGHHFPLSNLSICDNLRDANFSWLDRV